MRHLVIPRVFPSLPATIGVRQPSLKGDRRIPRPGMAEVRGVVCSGWATEHVQRLGVLARLIAVREVAARVAAVTRTLWAAGDPAAVRVAAAVDRGRPRDVDV